MLTLLLALPTLALLMVLKLLLALPLLLLLVTPLTTFWVLLSGRLLFYQPLPATCAPSCWLNCLLFCSISILNIGQLLSLQSVILLSAMATITSSNDVRLS